MQRDLQDFLGQVNHGGRARVPAARHQHQPHPANVDRQRLLQHRPAVPEQRRRQRRQQRHARGEDRRSGSHPHLSSTVGQGQGGEGDQAFRFDRVAGEREGAGPLGPDATDVIFMLVRQHHRRHLGQVHAQHLGVVDQGRAGAAKQVQAGVEQQQLPASPDQIGDPGLAPQPGPLHPSVDQRQHAQAVHGADVAQPLVGGVGKPPPHLGNHPPMLHRRPCSRGRTGCNQTRGDCS
jgi:hypothetical protein